MGGARGWSARGLLAVSLVLLAGWSAGAAAAAAAPLMVSVPVLMYHHLGAPVGHASENQFYVPPAAFEAQMAYLAANGFTAVSLEQVAEALQGRAALPAQPVAITFDDANQDSFDLALPVLVQHGLTATFLIPTGWVGQPGRLTWDEIAAMHLAGMHFGAHTIDHPYLPRLALVDAAREINGSKADLEAHLGQPVVVFAYPFGHTSPSITRLVQAAGFQLALGTSPYRLAHSADDQFYLTRLGVYDWTTLSYFKAHLPAPAGAPVPSLSLGAMLQTILLGVGFYP